MYGDDYEFVMLGNDIYTNVGTAGYWYRGYFIERKKINGTEYFIFKTEEFREDGMTYDGEFQPLKQTSRKNKPFVVGFFNKNDEGLCQFCTEENYINILGNYIVALNFDKI